MYRPNLLGCQVSKKVNTMATKRVRFTGPELRALQDIRLVQESNPDSKPDPDLRQSYFHDDWFSKERMNRSTPAQDLVSIMYDES